MKIKNRNAVRNRQEASETGTLILTLPARKTAIS